MSRLPHPWLLAALLLSCASLAVQGPRATFSAAGFSAGRAVFSGVKSAVSAPQTVRLRNGATTPLRLTALTLDGPDAAAFVLVDPPGLPLTLEAGQTLALTLAFSPQGRRGVLTARLNAQVEGAPPLTLALSGLSTEGEQGEAEPPLDQVVRALGYRTEVGGPGLILGTAAPLLGQEVAAPLFQRAGTGAVRLRPVARYSPPDPLPFGFFTLRGQPELHPLGVVGAHQEQTLNPALESGTLGFDPGGEVFGIYTGPSSYSPTLDHSLDALNSGPTRHAIRVYPLVGENGRTLPGYLLAVEASSNGDYQDAVFILTGAEPAPAP